MPANTDQFYAALPVNDMPLGDLLTRDEFFNDVPADWHVVITDIRSSTQAVLKGRHENVNLVATGSIVSVLNIAFGMNVTIPFFFGGDGATFIMPPTIIDRVMQALALYKVNTLDNFSFDLRTGTIPVQEIYAKGHHMHIAKFSSSESFSIPIVLGNGLNYAEQIIKGDDYLLSTHQPQQEELDLTGMQCRWDRIAPPANKEEVVTLLVVATNGARQSDAFRKVMNKMDVLYGSPQKRQPISVDKLKFNSTFSRLSQEMRARLGKIKMFSLLQDWITSLYGYIYFHTQSGKTYLKRLVEMSDTLVIDGKINTVISGTAKQRAQLTSFLDELEAAGEIIYGLHVSSASIMSCYVRDLEDGHIHFVDGSEGGYTQAARMLKAKLRTV
jgi:hypothetical protein